MSTVHLLNNCPWFCAGKEALGHSSIAMAYFRERALPDDLKISGLWFLLGNQKPLLQKKRLCTLCSHGFAAPAPYLCSSSSSSCWGFCILLRSLGGCVGNNLPAAEFVHNSWREACQFYRICIKTFLRRCNCSRFSPGPRAVRKFAALGMLLRRRSFAIATPQKIQATSATIAQKSTFPQTWVQNDVHISICKTNALTSSILWNTISLTNTKTTTFESRKRMGWGRPRWVPHPLPSLLFPLLPFRQLLPHFLFDIFFLPYLLFHIFLSTFRLPCPSTTRLCCATLLLNRTCMWTHLQTQGNPPF